QIKAWQVLAGVRSAAVQEVAVLQLLEPGLLAALKTARSRATLPMTKERRGHEVNSPCKGTTVDSGICSLVCSEPLANAPYSVGRFCKPSGADGTVCKTVLHHWVDFCRTVLQTVRGRRDGLQNRPTDIGQMISCQLLTWAGQPWPPAKAGCP